jgi:hypothetical protein
MAKFQSNINAAGMDLNNISLDELVQVLKHQRFALHQEKELQAGIEQLLIQKSIEYTREVPLSKGSIIDFMVGNIGIEVKIKSAPKSIYYQCVRYCQFQEVNSIILLTNKIIKLPSTINKKPTRVINLGEAWL